MLTPLQELATAHARIKELTIENQQLRERVNALKVGSGMYLTLPVSKPFLLVSGYTDAGRG
jgi:hypothetical protein